EAARELVWRVTSEDCRPMRRAAQRRRVGQQLHDALDLDGAGL
ncbi:MAG: hypothetical protein AVDCRST_MAG44-1576, partial [uncultured Sphingomonas sp.]